MTEPRKSPRQARSHATVDAILAATAHILATEGVAAANTNCIAETAGVSIGSVYQYFPNKAALVGAVAVRHAEAMATLLSERIAASSGGSIDYVVKSAVRAIVAVHADAPELRRALIEELPRIGRPARLAEVKQEIVGAVARALAEKREEIGVRDLHTAAFIIVNTIEYLTFVAHGQAFGRARMCRLETELINMITRYLRGGSISDRARRPMT